MIENATLIQVTAPPQADNDGGETLATPTACDVRVLLDNPRRNQLLAIANKAVNVTAVMCVPLSEAAGIVEDASIRVRLDEADAAGGTGRPYQVKHRIDHVQAGLSHAEVYLQGR